VTARAVLHHIADAEAAIKNLVASLRNGGVLLLIEPDFLPVSVADRPRWANYWTQTIIELRGDLISSGKLNDALVDTFLRYGADSNWRTQAIAFTAVHGRAPGA
jgi:hypothetical protein